MSEIVIASVASMDTERIASLATAGPFTVLYLAGSYAEYVALRSRLPVGWSMPVPGPLLNAAAADLRHLAINIDAAWPTGRDRALWDSTRLGERGPLASTLMINLCRLAVFNTAVAQPGRYLVLGDNVAQQAIWARSARRAGHEVMWQRPLTTGTRPLCAALTSARRRASIAARLLGRKLVLARMRRRRPLLVDALRSCDVMMTVWGRANTFPEHGDVEHEANFGALPAYFRQMGRRISYLVYPLYTIPFHRVVANALRSRELVVLVEDLIPWWAIFRYVFSGIRFPALLKNVPAAELDASSVVRAEADRDRELAACVEAQLLRSVGRSLANRAIRPDLIMHLYEGQPWEKMLARGIRDHLPSTRVVGVQHAPFASTYISFFPSRRSVEAGALPDLLLATGEGYARWLRAAGVPDKRVRVLGAVRYEHAVTRSDRGAAILCCTGIDLDEAIELATKAALATQGLGRRLLINYHPVTDEPFRATLRSHVAQALGGATDHITFSTASMRELLPSAGVVLYTTSASCFEAVQSGRVAIYVGRDVELDYDKLPDAIALRCRSPAELQALLRKADDMRPQSTGALQDWLAPVVSVQVLAGMLASLPDGGCETQAYLRGAM